MDQDFIIRALKTFESVDATVQHIQEMQDSEVFNKTSISYPEEQSMGSCFSRKSTESKIHDSRSNNCEQRLTKDEIVELCRAYLVANKQKPKSIELLYDFTEHIQEAYFDRLQYR